MISLNGGIVDKTKDHIERSHQVGKCLEWRYQCVTDFTQSQHSKIRLQDLLSNPIVEIKSEQVKEEIKDNINVLICKWIVIVTL